MGWHVYFKGIGRTGVRLAGDRENAIGIACALVREGRDVVRIVTHDRAESIEVQSIRLMCSAHAMSPSDVMDSAKI